LVDPNLASSTSPNPKLSSRNKPNLSLSLAVRLFAVWAVMIFLLIQIWFARSRCCGMTTHAFISHRALQFVSKDLQELLVKHYPYLIAGSFFPDWGYSCFQRGEASEVAHWPPFWEEALKLNGGEELAVFLFGMTSHGVADASWHSLNTDQGFIQYLQEMDFSGNYKDAHDAADFGGEMVLAHSSKLDFLSLIWKWPTADLVRIYKNIGINGNQGGINFSHTL